MDKIQKGIIHLLNGEGVFYASLLMQMQRRLAKDLPEHALAAVSVENGRIVLHVDPPRLEKFNVDQVSRILEHECLHLVLEHISRLSQRDMKIWNIAADLAVNSLITGMDLGLLPGKDQFKDFPSHKTAEYYYARIADKVRKKEVKFNKDGTVTIKDSKTGKEETYKPTGDHEGWKKSSGGEADSLTKEGIKQAVGEAYRQAKQAGKLPGNIKEIIEELLGANKVPWQRLLRQYVGNKVRSGKKYSWKRLSRRFGDQQKGKITTRSISLGIVIDTSGSVSIEEFQEFMNEIYGIMSCYKTKIIVMECDAQVQKVYDLKRFQKVDTKFAGRGGTDFRPPFEWFEKEGRGRKPELLVFFTDLYGPFPDKETIKTIWVRCSTSEVDKVPFGRLLEIPPKEGAKRRR